VRVHSSGFVGIHVLAFLPFWCSGPARPGGSVRGLAASWRWLRLKDELIAI
jgi:hypothetical protein